MILEMKCCGRTDPLGVDKENIHLTFVCDGSISVDTWEAEVWEAATGKPVCRLPGGEAINAVTVDPGCLQDRTAYRWRVILHTAAGERILSESAGFETGLSTWSGAWIGGKGPEGAALAFLKEFQLHRQPQKARLYICGLGYFEPRLNGTALDDSYFIPPVTDYTPRAGMDPAHISTHHRVTYYTYDVTDKLRVGSNRLSALVAEGYYGNREKYLYEPQPDYAFGQPCLLYELHIQENTGLWVKFVSDGTTLVRTTNQISRLYSGDRVDFTAALAKFENACLLPAPEGVLTAPMCAPDRVKQIFSPVTSWETPEGTVYDFGVNHSGGLEFTAAAAERTELVIRYAEVLNPDGTLNYETAAWHGRHVETDEKKHIYQENRYRLKVGSNCVTPGFSWFCYRYVLIPRLPGVEIYGLKSLFICMDTEADGHFGCSEPMLERINNTFLQTLRCNMHSGLVMDCPHRERLPYTGDGKLVMKSACYNLDVTGFYYKWFRDILDSQTAEGLIPNSAPYLGGGGGYAWGNAICTVSSQLYRLTGDRQVARQGYEAVIRWLGYYESKRDENYVIRSNSHTWMLGDWLAPETVTSDVYYISTVCYLQAVKTALFFAQILDTDRVAHWQSLCRQITEGINRVFFHEETCTYGNGVQGENMLALYENIVPEGYRAKMEKALRRHYSVETDYHLDTGVVLTPMLLDYLTENGCRDIAWRMMTATTYPSYFDLMKDNTTFSEHWSKKWPDYYFGEPGNSRLVKGGGELSHCHPMYGSVVAWLYEKVAGLDLSGLYQKKVGITPSFMDSLTWAEAQKKTPFGQVRVKWSRTEDGCSIMLSIPQGLTAECCFPAACKSLKNEDTQQVYEPDERGYFRFTVGGGQWHLTGGAA